MQTMSIEEFESLLAQPNWVRTQEIDLLHSYEREEINNEGELHEITMLCGRADKVSTLQNISITYTEGFEYVEGDPSTLTTSLEGLNEPLCLEGIKVIDENGGELSPGEIFDMLDVAFSDVDYSETRS